MSPHNQLSGQYDPNSTRGHKVVADSLESLPSNHVTNARSWRGGGRGMVGGSLTEIFNLHDKQIKIRRYACEAKVFYWQF